MVPGVFSVKVVRTGVGTWVNKPIVLPDTVAVTSWCYEYGLYEESRHISSSIVCFLLMCF